MWRDAGLRWKDFLPEDQDVNKFVTEKVREFKFMWIYIYILIPLKKNHSKT